MQIMSISSGLKMIFHSVADKATASKNFVQYHTQLISAALSARSPLDHRKYHAVKLFGLTSLCLASTFSLNVEGVIGAGFATADEVTRLEKAGRDVLNNFPTPKA